MPLLNSEHDYDQEIADLINGRAKIWLLIGAGLVVVSLVLSLVTGLVW